VGDVELLAGADSRTLVGLLVGETGLERLECDVGVFYVELDGGSQEGGQVIDDGFVAHV
jgi:hypothetical protein